MMQYRFDKIAFNSTAKKNDKRNGAAIQNRYLKNTYISASSTATKAKSIRNALLFSTLLFIHRSPFKIYITMITPLKIIFKFFLQFFGVHCSDSIYHSNNHYTYIRKNSKPHISNAHCSENKTQSLNAQSKNDIFLYYAHTS